MSGGSGTVSGAGGTARHRWLALAAMCVALSIVVIDNTILAVAIPEIANGLHADESALQWIGTSYGLVLAGLLLPLAVIGDRRGRKGFLLVGLVLLGAGSCAAAFAGSALVLALARGVMGVGGACTMPATLSLIGNIFDEGERGRAIAVWAATAGFAAAAGPIAGGLLLSQFWWGSVFLVNVPMAVLAIVMVCWLVPTSRDPGAPPVDRISALRWWGALTAALVAIIEGPQRGWTSPLVIGAAVLSVALLLLFGRREQRSPNPLIPPGTARDPRLRWGAATVFAIFFALMGVQFVVTQWLQGPLDYSPLGASVYFVPNALASVVAASMNPRAVARFGHGVVATASLWVLGGGALLAGGGVAVESVGVVVLGGLLIGAALGIGSASAIELIMSSAPPERAGSAAGVNETLVEAAGALGIAVLGSVFAATGSYAWPLPVAAVIAGLVAIGVRRVLVTRPRASTGSPIAPPA